MYCHFEGSTEECNEPIMNRDENFTGYEKKMMSEPLRLLPVILPVTRHGTSKEGHQKVNNKKEIKEMNKKND